MQTAITTDTATRRPDAQHLEALHRSYLQTKDAQQCEELIRAYQHLAYSIARRMSRQNRDREDIRQVALTALFKAINRYDPTRGVNFTTFAWRTIEGEIKRYFRDSTWAVHVPRSLQERSVTVQVAADELSHELGHSPAVRDIGDRVGLTDEEVVEVLELQRATRTASLDGVDEHDDDSAPVTQLGGIDPEFSRVDDRQELTALLGVLPARERLVVRLRFVDQLTQTEIANHVGLSQMHVSRLLAQSLARLRDRASGCATGGRR